MLCRFCLKRNKKDSKVFHNYIVLARLYPFIFKHVDTKELLASYTYFIENTYKF